MTANTQAAPAFPGNAPSFVTPTQRAALSVCRCTIEVPAGEQIEVTMPAQDAYAVLYQLKDHPPHRFRVDGKTRDIGPAPRATLNVVDLRGEACGQLRAPVDTLLFHLPRAALDEIAEEAGAARIDNMVAPDPWATADPIVDNLHGPLVDSLSTGLPVNRLLHDHILLGLGAHFAAAYGGMRPHRLTRGGLAPWQQRRAEELLAANLSGDVPLIDLARQCGLSAAHFARAFKRSTGATPHGWLQRRRIDTAKRLLVERVQPLAEIALSCGFADQSHFTRTFARLAGLTPGAWQRLQ